MAVHRPALQPDPVLRGVVPPPLGARRIASSHWLAQPAAAASLTGAADALLDTPRPTLAYFSGNLAGKEPLKYARGVRHRLVSAFEGKPGWMLVGGRGGMYAQDLRSSQFCIVPPGGDGWSSRVDDAVRHGCIPVILIDNVHLPFESVLRYDAFALRVPEADVPKLDQILRAIPDGRRRAMRAAMQSVWTRFAYASAVLDDEAYLPARASDGRTLPRPGGVAQLRLQMRARGLESAPDAIDTVLMALHARRRVNSSEGCE